MVHLGDDTDDRISPAELATNPYTPADDAAAGARRKEGILVHLPRVQANVVAIAFAVTSYTDEMGLAEAAGAEMRLCVGPTHSSGMTKRATSPYKSPISSPKEPYILPHRGLLTRPTALRARQRSRPLRAIERALQGRRALHARA